MLLFFTLLPLKGFPLFFRQLLASQRHLMPEYLCAVHAYSSASSTLKFLTTHLSISQTFAQLILDKSFVVKNLLQILFRIVVELNTHIITMIKNWLKSTPVWPCEKNLNSIMIFYLSVALNIFPNLSKFYQYQWRTIIQLASWCK